MRQWTSRKIFQSIHGRNLVYNTCWEDPRLDRAALQIGDRDTIAMITSAGCNALDYLLDRPAAIHCVDVNPRQNALLELKLAGFRSLRYADYFCLFGRGYWHDFSARYPSDLRPFLSPASQSFWDQRTHWFTKPKRPFFFRGTTGNFARWMNVYMDRIARVRPYVQQLFELTSVAEQAELFDRELWPKVWRWGLRTAISRDTTLAMLGVPGPQRRQVEQSFPGGIAGFVEQSLRSVFAQRPLQDNYFWRVYLLGEYSSNCCPEYLREENFAAIADGLFERVQTHTMTMQQFLQSHQGEISRFVLLDHMDWLADVYPKQLVAEWQSIVDRASIEARLIWRSGGLHTDYLDQVSIRSECGERFPLMQLLRFDRELAASLHCHDRVATYASFYVASMAA